MRKTSRNTGNTRADSSRRLPFKAFWQSLLAKAGIRNVSKNDRQVAKISSKAAIEQFCRQISLPTEPMPPRSPAKGGAAQFLLDRGAGMASEFMKEVLLAASVKNLQRKAEARALRKYRFRIRVLVRPKQPFVLPLPFITYGMKRKVLARGTKLHYPATAFTTQPLAAVVDANSLAYEGQ